MNITSKSSILKPAIYPIFHLLFLVSFIFIAACQPPEGNHSQPSHQSPKPSETSFADLSSLPSSTNGSKQPYEHTNSLPYNLPPLPELKDVKGKATGFFHAEKIDGRWWIIDPKGQAVYVKGINQLMPGGMDATRKEKEAAVKAAGGAESWINNSLKDLNRWGFNMVSLPHEPYFWSPHTATDLAKNGVFYARHLAFSYDFWRSVEGNEARERRCILWSGKWNSAADPFHPDWAAFCREYARKKVAQHRDDPWLLGWFIDNERSANNGDYVLRVVSRYNELRPCKRAMAQLAKEHFGTIDKFNAAFQTQFKSFQEFLADTKIGITICSPEAKAFGDLYVAKAAEAYYAPLCAAIREFDPNHMILGGRDSSGQYVDPLLKTASRYLDAYSLHTYRPVDLKKGMEARQVKHYKHVYEQVQLPLFLTEWSFPRAIPGEPNYGASGMMTLSYAEQGRCFQFFQEGLAQLPFMIGSMWFCWGDPVSHSREATWYGLVSTKGVPRPDMISKVTEANQNTSTLHLKSDDSFDGTTGWFENWNPSLPPLSPASSATALPIEVKDLRLEIHKNGKFLLSSPQHILAYLSFQLEQLSPQIRWPHTNSVTITKKGQNSSIIVIEGKADLNPKTSQGKVASDNSDLSFQVDFRLIISRQDPSWVSAQVLKVTNTSSRDWFLGRVFVKADPIMGHSAEQKGRTIATTRMHGWEHPKQPFGLGYTCPSPEMEMVHWRHGHRIIPETASCRIDKKLAAGESMEFKNTWLTIFSYPAGKSEPLIKQARAVEASMANLK